MLSAVRRREHIGAGDPTQHRDAGWHLRLMRKRESCPQIGCPQAGCHSVATADHRKHTDGMTHHRTQQAWIYHLDAAATRPNEAISLSESFERLTLAWHATAAVNRPASLATELGWMRLAEALVDAWTDLATAGSSPGSIDVNIGQPGHPLPDTPDARRAVARLIRATAADLRERSTTEADAELALASAADTLDSAVEDWSS